MPDISFAQSFWLWLLLLLPVWLRWRLHHPPAWPYIWPVLSIRFPLLPQSAVNESEDDAACGRLPDFIVAVALALFIVALAQPVTSLGAVKTQEKTQPVDLVLLIDTGISMTLTDYQVDAKMLDRMSMLRQLLQQFIDNYRGQRLGLVLMGNPPMLWLPFTGDRELVKKSVARIQTTLAGRLSDMSASLQLISESYATETDKVVVMLTSGGLQVGQQSPQDAAAEIAQQGYSLYVLATGAADSGDRPAAGAGLIYEPVNLGLLAEVAEQGNGELFHVVDAAAVAAALQKIEQKHYRVIAPAADIQLVQAWYPLPLLSGMLLILHVLSISRPGERRA